MNGAGGDVIVGGAEGIDCPDVRDDVVDIKPVLSHPSSKAQ